MKSSTVEKRVRLRPSEAKRLKRRAEQLQVSEAEVIRRGVLETLREPLFEPDLRAWERELRFIERRARMPSTPSRRSWTREDAYDERLGRVPG